MPSSFRDCVIFGSGGTAAGISDGNLSRSLALPVLRLFFDIRNEYLKVPRNPETYPWHWQRAEILERLQHSGGQHLVIVRYSPEDPFHEWVYNRADIDAADVIWAQDMGEKNQELIKYFVQRRVWLLEPNEPGMAKLSPYICPY